MILIVMKFVMSMKLLVVTDDTACNYNVLATDSDSSCDYAATGYDCVGNCLSGYINDCNGNCAPANWVGDNYCDDGSYAFGGQSIYFNCYEFDNDGDDCTSSFTTAGCLDSNALNYDPMAYIQATDEYGNLICTYESCDYIPDEEGCMFPDAYNPYFDGFGPEECSSYGGYACISEGCSDEKCM